MIDRDVLRKFWDERAKNADDPRSVTLDRESAASTLRNIRMHQRWLFRQLEQAGCNPRRVLDLGCGNGDWTIALAERATRLTAVDYTAGLVDHCRQRLQRLDLLDRATVLHGDVATVELAGPYDLIVFGAVAQYLTDDEIAHLLARISRALAPTGVLYLRTTIARHAERRAKQTTDYQAIYRSFDWYRKQLIDAGLEVGAHGFATSLIGTELAYRTFGEHAVSRAFALPIQAVRWLYRFPRGYDVFVCVARHPTEELRDSGVSGTSWRKRQA